METVKRRATVDVVADVVVFADAAAFAAAHSVADAPAPFCAKFVELVPTIETNPWRDRKAFLASHVMIAW